MSEPRWWGWGAADVTYDLASRPRFLPFLDATLGPLDATPHPVADPDAISLPPVRLDDAALAELTAILGPDGLSTDRLQRIKHALGRSYRDLVRLRSGRIDRAPDAVAFPATEEAVAAVLALAARRGFSVVPFGGGTSVTGGVEALGTRPTVCLDLARLDRLLALDPVSHTATAQAGIRGPALEAALGAQGFTLGHFPQSWEFSSLGGWIATRSAGQQSTGYGKIEDMVVSLTLATSRAPLVVPGEPLATPSGILETRAVPATAAGPGLLQAVIGSEGIFGVITRAVLKVRPVPRDRSYQSAAFRTFAGGLAALRQIIQSDLRPVTLRLSDPAETLASLMLQRRHGGPGAVVQQAGTEVLARLGWDLRPASAIPAQQRPCLLIVGCEGDDADNQAGACLTICRRHGAVGLTSGVARQWLDERFALPYLRDVLLDRGVMTDTLETATLWSNLEALHARVTAALAGAGPGYVMCHVSHVYPAGASLYFTFLARQEAGDEEGKWRRIKVAATDAIMAGGGTLSHHHGVGYEHAPWMEDEVGPLGVAAICGLKSALDPAGIMNPGKVVGEG